MPMSVLTVSGLSKTYATGFHALKNVDLDIRRGEIFALLGPNGAGKTTLINIVCGIVTPSGGEAVAAGSNWQGGGGRGRREELAGRPRPRARPYRPGPGGAALPCLRAGAADGRFLARVVR